MTQASQDKPEKRYYRIGEVARITGVKPYVLRYWESEFRWMAPPKSRSKQRLYRKRDIDMILLIKKLLYEERFTIEGARKRLRELGVDGALESAAPESAAAPAPEAAQLPLPAGLDIRAEVGRLRDELQTIRGLL
ncbi:MAG: MerR family transcriptional regulator [Gammaproteobacteria bacterium]|nr:MerR family transcriptional regulator [Gammaproteobacteria bacterium]